MRAPRPAPTPIPILAPELSPPEDALLLLTPPAPAAGEVVWGAAVDVTVEPFDVRTVIGLLLELSALEVTVLEVVSEVLIDVTVVEVEEELDAEVVPRKLDAVSVEELLLVLLILLVLLRLLELLLLVELLVLVALLLVDADCCDGVVDAGATKEELGDWPAKNCMLCPVLLGREHILVRVFESLKATVADAALVQLQYAPGWRVEGFPSCEQIAHSPSLLSQSVSATQG